MMQKVRFQTKMSSIRKQLQQETFQKNEIVIRNEKLEEDLGDQNILSGDEDEDPLENQRNYSEDENLEHEKDKKAKFETKRNIKSNSNSSETLQQILIELKTLRRKVENIENVLAKNNGSVFSESEEEVKTAIIKQNLVYSKKTYKILQNFINEDADKHELDIESFFPIKTENDMEVIEEKLLENEYTKKMVLYFRKFKALDVMFKFVATDEFYIHCNFKGVAGKRALKNYKLFNTVLFDASGETILDYELQMRKCIQKSHNRYYKVWKCSTKTEDDN